jgi:alkylated DNA nucleotide flippase Atl1
VPPLAACAKQIADYLDGGRRHFDLPISAAGTDFQRRVWEEIARVPYGKTITYAELAERAGLAGSARAAGAATGRNPSRSSCRAIAWSAPRARSRATPAASTASNASRARGDRGLRACRLARLVAVGAMWGASYIFMRYAVPYLGRFR